MVKSEDSGPLKGYPVLEGSIKNNGTRTVADILLRARLLDKSGASMYEVVFRPQEPSLGRSGLAEISIPYINHSNRTAVKPGSSMPFKKILRECPKEIMGELERARSSGRVMYSMPDNISCEILSLEV
jgi:hypothetical protein